MRLFFFFFLKNYKKKKTYHTDPKCLNGSVSLQLLELQEMIYVCWWLNWVALSFTRVFLYSSCVKTRESSLYGDGWGLEKYSLIN